MFSLAYEGVTNLFSIADPVLRDFYNNLSVLDLPLPPLISLLCKNPFLVEPTLCRLHVSSERQTVVEEDQEFWLACSNLREGWQRTSSPPALSDHPSVFPDLTPFPSLQKYSFTYFLSLQKSGITTPPWPADDPDSSFTEAINRRAAPSLPSA